MTKSEMQFQNEYVACSTGHHIVKLVVGYYKENNRLALAKVTHVNIAIMLQYHVHATC